MEVFLTPDAPRKMEKMGKNVKSGPFVYLGEKLAEKRDRTSGNETDTDSIDSRSCEGLRITRSKRKKVVEKREIVSMEPIVHISDSGAEEETYRKGEEGDVFEEIKELEHLLRKTRNSTREVRGYTIENSELLRANIVNHAAQADRQLEAALTRVISIGLRVENQKLKKALQIREQGTQSSPCLENRGKMGEGNMDRKHREYRQQRKSRTKQWETDGREDETEGEEGQRGVDRTETEKEGTSMEGNKEVNEKGESNWVVVNRNKNRGGKSVRSSKGNEEEGDKAGNKIEGIQTVRKSRGGDLIIEMEKGREGVNLEKAVKEVLGEEHKIKRVAPKIFYEVRDIDPTLEREEVRNEIAKALQIENSEIEVKTVRFGYGGTKTAIITVPTGMLEKIGEENKVRVGYTACKMRRTQNLVRCFKCHDFGHLSYNCKLEIQGKELCRRCGKVGHQINGCEAIKSCILCIRAGIPAINLNHCRLAHYLLMQTAIDLNANIVLIAEPLFNPGNWIYSKKGTAAIWTCDLKGKKRLEDGDVIDEDFVAIKINKETYISIYLSPNMSTDEYAYRLSILSEFISKERRKGRSICVGGDFNAKSPSWGSKEQNDKGSILLDRFLEWGLTPIKPEGGHTYERGQVKSNLDFIAVTRDLTRDRETVTNIIDVEWRVTKAGLEKSIEIADEIWREKRLITQEKYREEEEKKFLGALPEICERAFEKIKTGEGKKKKANIWWNDEIREQRSKTNNLRRKKSKRVLQRLIAKEKERKWKELCETINKDPWGKPYKTVIRQVKPDTPPVNISTEMAKEVLKELFPSDGGKEAANEREENTRNREGERGEMREMNQEVREEREREREEIPRITMEEILRAVKNLKPNKAAGLDGMIPEIIKKLAERRPDRFQALFNGIFERGRIPGEWKKARTILLRKPGKNPDEPSAYRPICVIDAIAKMMEYITRDRLEKEMGRESFDKNQYGFVKGRSTVHAMTKVVEDAWTATDKQRFGVMIALDVRNAFNTLRWDTIIEQMKMRGFSDYLTRLMQDYFNERTICYKNSDETIWREMKMGVPQGSVLGPFMWNLVYDDLLKRENPEMTSKYAFADDIIITIQASTINGLRKRIERVVEDTRKWMKTKGLSLAEQKTEIMLMNKKKIEGGLEIRIGGTKIKPSPFLKYLGVTFDEKKNFKKHIEDATNKAIKTMTVLSSLMTNGKRTSQAVRRLFYMTLEAIVLYGAPVWAEGALANRNKNTLRKTQKLGLGRVVSAYRTVPQETLCVLAGITPWHLKIQERKQLFQIENQILKEENIDNIKTLCREGRNLGTIHEILEGLRLELEEEEGEESLKKSVKIWIRRRMKDITDILWQREWEREVVGRWTYRLIPNIVKWRKRKYGQLSFYVTQVLTGHGVFNTYRERIGKSETGECWYHQNCPDTPEHTIIDCEERDRLTIEKLMEESVKKGENWIAFEGFCRRVMKRKEEEERRREKMAGETPTLRDIQADLESGDTERRRDL
ncbi:uncharacterized protein LOC143364090 [Halictus rubicundus]|uniref:uncharacterized protein LOC143364090 n=1 Tax=Halictus rubicundus TaxID=77578 RepID=UPI00403643FE